METKENREISPSENKNRSSGAIDLSEVRLEQIPQHHHRRHHHHHRRIHWKKILKWVLVFLAVLVIAAVIFAVYFFNSGKKALLKGNNQRPVLESSLSDGTSLDLETVDDDTIVYNGTTYKYRDKMINLLLIGVDTTGTFANPMIQGSRNGQADVLVMVSLDLEKNKITMIPINRDTMTQITITNANGEAIRNMKEQIAMSYAYGKDDADSAKLTQEAVSHLFYGLPISGYFTFNISAIPVVNDLVGGVEVTLPEDFVDEWGDSYVKGTTTTLTGEMAETFIRARSGMKDQTNEARMKRERQYFINMAKKAMQETKSNPSLPLTIYQSLEDYMVTDISASEFSYLAAKIVSCDFSEDNIKEIQGTSKQGTVYNEFYVDEQKLYELILDVYYEAQ